MADDKDKRKIAGVVAVTKTRQIKRDLLGRVTDERTQVAVSINASVPNELIEAAKAVSSAAPKIAAGAHTLSDALKARTLDALPSPRGKKT